MLTTLEHGMPYGLAQDDLSMPARQSARDLVMTFIPNKPYNDLPSLPPPVDLETKTVLKKCISANRALAELKGAGDLIPNQAMLINVVPLQEAKLSSEIENIVTTNDRLFRAAVEEGREHDSQTKEVLQYRTALRYGYETLAERPLSINLFNEICGIILGQRVTVRKTPSTVLKNPDTQEVVYTPPVGEEVLLKKLANLERYLHEPNDLDPLIRLAVIHYQFEAIHPYHDGNGRTGRIINILYLVERDLLRIPVLYLSRYIIQNKAKYYQLLRAVTTQQEWEPWVLYMLDAVETTATWTTERIIAVHDLFEETCERCRTQLPSKIYSKELIELTFVQPYCKIAFVVEAGIAQRQTAARYLQALEKIGVLSSVKLGREKYYVNPGLIDVLSV